MSELATCSECRHWAHVYGGEGVCRLLDSDLRTSPGGLFRILGDFGEEKYAKLRLQTTEDFGCNAFQKGRDHE